MDILCIITGGTIDKHYNTQTGLLNFTSSSIQSMFKQGRITHDIQFETLFLKDSLEHTQQDKDTLIQACKTSGHDKIIITHGTDTMVESSSQLAQQCPNKTIVLVGSMIPYSIQNSDASFNLGAAIIAIQLLPYGTYIVMNGSIFNANQTIKNHQLGVFEAL